MKRKKWKQPWLRKRPWEFNMFHFLVSFQLILPMYQCFIYILCHTSIMSLDSIHTWAARQSVSVKRRSSSKRSKRLRICPFDHGPLLEERLNGIFAEMAIERSGSTCLLSWKTEGIFKNFWCYYYSREPYQTGRTPAKRGGRSFLAGDELTCEPSAFDSL